MTAMNPLRNILNDTPATAIDIDWNFQAVEDYVSTDVIKRDGSTAMDAPLNLLGPAPSLPTHAITKGYVDTAIIPIGTIWQFAGDVAPASWVFCDGTERNSTDPAWVPLFQVIGYKYGQNGTNFKLPDMQGRVPVGRLPNDGALGTLGSKNAITARNAAVPNHTHPMAQHTHGMADHVHNRGAHAHGIAAHQHYMAHQHNAPFRKGYNIYTANDGGFGGAWKETNTTFKPNAPILAFSLRETALWTGEPPGGPDTAVSGIINSSTGDFTNTNHGSIGQATSTDGDGGTTGMTAAANVGYNGTPNTDNPSGGVSATDANLPPYTVVNFIIRIG